MAKFYEACLHCEVVQLSRSPLCADCGWQWGWCSTCKQVKPYTEFYPAKKRAFGIGSYCRACTSAYHNGKGEARKKELITSRRGLTLEEYNLLVEKQEGRCAICKTVPPASLCIDHSHLTGTNRELLCRRCNMGLGYFDDNPEVVATAAAYLQRWSE